MFTNIRKKYLLLFTAVTLIVLYLFFTNKEDEIDCVSTFYNIPDDSSWEYIKGTLSVTLFRNGYGEAMFSGNGVKRESSKNIDFERLINFHFEKIDDRNYILKDILITKYASDNMDDDIFSKYVYTPTSQKTDHLVILKINNSFIVGHMVGPRQICIQR